MLPPGRIRLLRSSLPRLLAWTTVVGPVLLVVSPWLGDWTTYGTHDWDFETSQRLLTTVSLLRYGQAPYWDPYACGGVPAWGYIEGATNLVSPWLLAYLALPVTVAVRLEVLGSGLLGAAGAFAAAGRLTPSFASRAFVVALWAVNGRWSLQIAAGHTWHLLYAWMPWCFYFYERACEGRLWPSLALAACFASLVYGGGIYPLPHVVLALSLYAAALSVAERSSRPLWPLGLAGALGVLFSAPKLVPMLHEFARTPRLIASPETTPLRVLWLALTSRAQDLSARVSGLGPPYWHEYGIYVSLVGIVVLAVASMTAWTPRETALRGIGLLFGVLGLGAFHRAAPWTLLHAHIPFFASEHVPSRFLYPALLLLLLASARPLGQLAARREWIEPALGAFVLALALDVAVVARRSMVESMHLRLPPVTAMPFRHEESSPFRAMPSTLAILRNQGNIRCYGAVEDRIGARSATDARYRGEAFVLAPDGTGAVVAPIADWSPNRVVIDARGAAPGTTLVYNMNGDDGWTSDAGSVIAVDDAVAVMVTQPRDSVTFTYRPRGLVPGLLLGALGLGLASALALRERRATTVVG
jgi:hypothetical protein